MAEAMQELLGTSRIGFKSAARVKEEWSADGAKWKEEKAPEAPEGAADALAKVQAKAKAAKAEEQKPLWEVLREAKEQRDAEEAEERTGGVGKNVDADFSFHHKLEEKKRLEELERKKDDGRKVREFEAEVAGRVKRDEKEQQKTRLHSTAFGTDVEVTDSALDGLDIVPQKKRRKAKKKPAVGLAIGY
eukprot:Rhum_TRINITY_DN1935_c0_g1::Rhum_TRINITY_DN1935_c0_g1_i1::g.5244::m.5244